MKIDYFLNGIVNGQYLEVKGTGNTDDENGGYKIDLNSIIAPIGWDPGVIIMICCGNFTFYSSKISDQSIYKDKSELLPLKLGNYVGRKGTISNDKGEYVTALQARGFLWQESNVLFSRSVIVDGFSKLNEYGGIKSIEEFHEEIIPSVNKHATGLSNYIIHTNDGQKLYGEAYFPYTFDNFNLKNRIIVKATNINTGFEQFIKSNRQQTSISVTTKIG